jgi:hypothetical protein
MVAIRSIGIRAGQCACDGCPGHLSDAGLSKCGWGFVCRCDRQVSAPDGDGYAATVSSDLHQPPPSPKITPVADDSHH